MMLRASVVSLVNMYNHFSLIFQDTQNMYILMPGPFSFFCPFSFCHFFFPLFLFILFFSITGYNLMNTFE